MSEVYQNFYSHAPRGARLSLIVSISAPWISTHTPLAGRDYPHNPPSTQHSISTHTPLAGRDRCTPSRAPLLVVISTHTPLAGRDAPVISVFLSIVNFYSHAPRGARPIRFYNLMLTLLFLLTRPSRGATADGQEHSFGGYISTHTPLAGRDLIFGLST